MDLEGLRSLGVEYAILDKETADHYHLYDSAAVAPYEKPQKASSHHGYNHRGYRVDVDEKRLLKLEINRIRMAERRAKETEEERALRLYKNRMRNRLRRATETPEQRAERNRRNMERNRLRRIRQREQQSETDGSSSSVQSTPMQATPVNTAATTTTTTSSKEFSLNKSSGYYINDLVRVELSASPETQQTSAVTPTTTAATTTSSSASSASNEPLSLSQFENRYVSINYFKSVQCVNQTCTTCHPVRPSAAFGNNFYLQKMFL